LQERETEKSLCESIRDGGDSTIMWAVPDPQIAGRKWVANAINLFPAIKDLPRGAGAGFDGI
jgi:hypothetical protein